MTTRRDFMQQSALALTAAGVPQFAQAAQSTSTAASWYDRPMRWAQLTLVEDDPGKYDPAFWLDYFRRTHSDAACLSAGGCVAYYPTKVPLHYRSKFLGDRDCFGELVAGCRKLGMNVVARTDPHAAHQDVYDAHPDWIAVTADGKKRKHWADPELWVTCGLGPYNFEFMTEVTREIVRLYNVDGIFSNRWDGSGMCYCEHCRQNFKIDRTFWEVLSADHGRVLRNAVAWASNEEQPLRVEGQGVIDVSLWMQKDSITAHLVNLTNPMMMKGPVREIIPAPPQKVRIRVPDGRRVKKVQLLVGGKTPMYLEAGNLLSMTVPFIDLHEVIALDLA